MEAVNTRDLDKAVLVYTDDCSMMAPGLDVAHGHEGKVYTDITSIVQDVICLPWTHTLSLASYCVITLR